jgi:tetratricopeptide (TPR) repeat protein
MLKNDGILDKADFISKRVLEINPNDVNILCDYAHLLDEMGNLDTAEAIYKRDLEIDPVHVRILNGYSLLLDKKVRVC